jgi:hypothetical protein
LSFTRLLNTDGTPYTDHTGGIEYFGKYVYITGEDNHGLDVFSAEDILSGNGEARMLGTVRTYNTPAQVSIYEYNGQKYIMPGSYHRDGTVYETPGHEKITTPSGDENTSVMTVFKLDENAEFGIQPEPVAIISTREMIQGICTTPDGQMVLSTSWGVLTSKLFFYDLSKVQCTENYRYTGEIKYGDIASGEVTGIEGFDFTLPCYYVDSSCLVNTVYAPPMSEELVCLDGRIIVFCESASNKCMFGKLTTGFKTYAYEYITLE